MAKTGREGPVAWSSSTYAVEIEEVELTDKMVEALIIAYELGYFNKPRRATNQDIADRLDVNCSSACQRIRSAENRLYHKLVPELQPEDKIDQIATRVGVTNEWSARR